MFLTTSFGKSSPESAPKQNCIAQVKSLRPNAAQKQLQKQRNITISLSRFEAPQSKQEDVHIYMGH